MTGWYDKSYNMGENKDILADRLHAGNGIRLDHRHFLFPSKSFSSIKESYPRLYVPGPPAFYLKNKAEINVTDPGYDRKTKRLPLNLFGVKPNISGSPFGLHKIHPESVWKLEPLERAPKLETDINNLGTDCSLAGYSRTTESKMRRRVRRGNSPEFLVLLPTKPPILRKWAEIPVINPRKMDCENGTCYLTIPNNTPRGYCSTDGDNGLPVYCGPSNNRKITYLTYNTRYTSSFCIDSFSAYHVPRMVDELTKTVERSNGRGR